MHLILIRFCFSHFKADFNVLLNVLGLFFFVFFPYFFKTLFKLKDIGPSLEYQSCRGNAFVPLTKKGGISNNKSKCLCEHFKGHQCHFEVNRGNFFCGFSYSLKIISAPSLAVKHDVYRQEESVSLYPSPPSSVTAVSQHKTLQSGLRDLIAHLMYYPFIKAETHMPRKEKKRQSPSELLEDVDVAEAMIKDSSSLSLSMSALVSGRDKPVIDQAPYPVMLPATVLADGIWRGHHRDPLCGLFGVNWPDPDA